MISRIESVYHENQKARATALSISQRSFKSAETILRERGHISGLNVSKNRSTLPHAKEVLTSIPPHEKDMRRFIGGLLSHFLKGEEDGNGNQ